MLTTETLSDPGTVILISASDPNFQKNPTFLAMCQENGSTVLRFRLEGTPPNSVMVESSPAKQFVLRNPKNNDPVTNQIFASAARLTLLPNDPDRAKLDETLGENTKNIPITLKYGVGDTEKITAEWDRTRQKISENDPLYQELRGQIPELHDDPSAGEAFFFKQQNGAFLIEKSDGTLLTSIDVSPAAQVDDLSSRLSERWASQTTNVPVEKPNDFALRLKAICDAQERVVLIPREKPGMFILSAQNEEGLQLSHSTVDFSQTGFADEITRRFSSPAKVGAWTNLGTLQAESSSDIEQLMKLVTQRKRQRDNFSEIIRDQLYPYLDIKNYLELASLSSDAHADLLGQSVTIDNIDSSPVSRISKIADAIQDCRSKGDVPHILKLAKTGKRSSEESEKASYFMTLEGHLQDHENATLPIARKSLILIGDEKATVESSFSQHSSMPAWQAFLRNRLGPKNLQDTIDAYRECPDSNQINELATVLIDYAKERIEPQASTPDTTGANKILRDLLAKPFLPKKFRERIINLPNLETATLNSFVTYADQDELQDALKHTGSDLHTLQGIVKKQSCSSATLFGILNHNAIDQGVFRDCINHENANTELLRQAKDHPTRSNVETLQIIAGKENKVTKGILTSILWDTRANSLVEQNICRNKTYGLLLIDDVLNKYEKKKSNENPDIPLIDAMLSQENLHHNTLERLLKCFEKSSTPSTCQLLAKQQNLTNEQISRIINKSQGNMFSDIIIALLEPTPVNKETFDAILQKIAIEKVSLDHSYRHDQGDKALKFIISHQDKFDLSFERLIEIPNIGANTLTDFFKNKTRTPEEASKALDYLHSQNENTRSVLENMRNVPFNDGPSLIDLLAERYSQPEIQEKIINSQFLTLTALDLMANHPETNTEILKAMHQIGIKLAPDLVYQKRISNLYGKIGQHPNLGAYQTPDPLFNEARSTGDNTMLVDALSRFGISRGRVGCIVS